MEHNPFAPPSSVDDAPPDRELVFSVEGVAIVSSLASWMRAMALLLYLGAGLLSLGAALTCSTRTTMLLPSVIAAFIIVIIGLGVAGTWLRSAASGFERGVVNGDEVPIGQGFRALRAYLVLFGIVGILGVLSQLYRML